MIGSQKKKKALAFLRDRSLIHPCPTSEPLFCTAINLICYFPAFQHLAKWVLPPQQWATWLSDGVAGPSPPHPPSKYGYI